MGITNQAPTLLSQYTVPGQAAPIHFASLYMGINDIGGGATATNLYAGWKTAMMPLLEGGWSPIAISLTPVGNYNSTFDTQRLTFNSLLSTGGYWSGFIDWANDPRMTNPNYPQYTNGSSIAFGMFDPYYDDASALHPSALGASALSGRYLAKMNDLGAVGRGTNYTIPYAQYVDVDLSKGKSQTLTLTGDVSTLKVINGNQGDKFDLTICQDGTGGHTVPAVAVGSGATATVTSAGVMTLTAGGSGYDGNYLPVFYVSGLTCTQYPRYSSTITAGAVASISQSIAGSGCTGTGTVTAVSTEPKWNNFDSTAVNALAAGACLKQSFTFDDKAQTIN
jgi:hypothetical protein